jgi:hypothetical protein
MRAARPSELKTEAVPALRAELLREELSELFPVKMKSIDPLSEPEPSEGILLRLKSGDYAVLVYGKSSGMLTVLAPQAKLKRTIDSLLDEAPIPSEKIVWRASSERQPHTNGSSSEMKHRKKKLIDKVTRRGRLTLRSRGTHRRRKGELGQDLRIGLLEPLNRLSSRRIRKEGRRRQGTEAGLDL